MQKPQGPKEDDNYVNESRALKGIPPKLLSTDLLVPTFYLLRPRRSAFDDYGGFNEPIPWLGGFYHNIARPVVIFQVLAARPFGVRLVHWVMAVRAVPIYRLWNASSHGCQGHVYNRYKSPERNILFVIYAKRARCQSSLKHLNLSSKILPSS